MKFPVLSLILVVAMTSKAIAQTAPSVPTLKFYSCNVSMMQRLKLTSGDDFEKVVDKNKCFLESETPIQEALNSALKGSKTTDSQGNRGVLVKGKENPSVFVMNQPQYIEIVESLVEARKNNIGLSVYFLAYEAAYKSRGLPNPINMYSIENAQLTIEPSK